MTTDTIARRKEGRGLIGRAATDWLCLAAAPTFAAMALLTGLLGGGAPDPMCSVGQHASPLSGMVAMYLLMSVVHSAAWLKLVFDSKGSAGSK